MMFLGNWAGRKLYGVNCSEYRDMYQTRKLEENIGYVLADNNNYIVVNREVVGQLNQNTVRPNKGKMPAWADAVGFAVASTPVVITERPTVEALASKNKVVVKPTPIDELAAEGEAKLKAVVAEGKVKTTRRRSTTAKKVRE
ncbi:MAG: hypothetical protein E7270_01865 [Lachnospiraceae bacterium]|nr:hypothetical protein [Lachnospiraceae bacterium]